MTSLSENFVSPAAFLQGFGWVDLNEWCEDEWWDKLTVGFAVWKKDAHTGHGRQVVTFGKHLSMPPHPSAGWIGMKGINYEKRIECSRRTGLTRWPRYLIN
jgi:hypothetical protein